MSNQSQEGPRRRVLAQDGQSYSPPESHADVHVQEKLPGAVRQRPHLRLPRRHGKETPPLPMR